MTECELTAYCCHPPVAESRYTGDFDGFPSETIVEAIAEAADVDPFELPPLYEFVDPDAIDALFRNREKAATSNIHLRFQMDSCVVFVRSDGAIRVCDSTRSTEPKPVFE